MPRQTFTPIHVTPSPSCDTEPFRTPKASFPRPRPRPRSPFCSFGNKPELCSVDPLLPPTNRGRSSGFQIDAGLVFFRFLVLCRPASLFSVQAVEKVGPLSGIRHDDLWIFNSNEHTHRILRAPWESTCRADRGGVIEARIPLSLRWRHTGRPGRSSHQPAGGSIRPSCRSLNPRSR